MATFFFSTASQHGGQETTALTSLTTLAHHGIIYVPLGFTSPHLSDNSEVIGGSAYGAGTIANGDGSRMPSAKELEVAVHQGEYFTSIVAQYVRGRE
ncbi:TrpR binding protein WrbA [Basidiobolus meristosporus CBS 931.73]|uniref:TrpR binding protein WrbA n=1 Tax=Basidiobolus meristosporus CBS 931.73 TaxID=1314790 RepID=A0A1Y1X3Q1_9FUNG|nr:TrpR binding protein WrbA [Basidiobolus meristosporus CBS 931.73]|eukprot:ORX80431.1 TrpR binding protein WrbA [Basidiobolus meristosporus CBS 931.73]